MYESITLSKAYAVVLLCDICKKAMQSVQSYNGVESLTTPDIKFILKERHQDKECNEKLVACSLDCLEIYIKNKRWGEAQERRLSENREAARIEREELEQKFSRFF